MLGHKRRPYRTSADRVASAISNLYIFFARPRPSFLFMSILLRESTLTVASTTTTCSRLELHDGQLLTAH